MQHPQGCLLIGALEQRRSALPDKIAIGLTSGFCGSLTTFSGWMLHIAVQARRGDVVAAVGNACLSLFAFMSAHEFGYLCAKSPGRVGSCEAPVQASVLSSPAPPGEAAALAAENKRSDDRVAPDPEAPSPGAKQVKAVTGPATGVPQTRRGGALLPDTEHALFAALRSSSAAGPN